MSDLNTVIGTMKTYRTSVALRQSSVAETVDAVHQHGLHHFEEPPDDRAEASICSTSVASVHPNCLKTAERTRARRPR